LHRSTDCGEPSAGLLAFWDALPHSARRKLLRVDKARLFTEIRARYCSRCYGLFALRYEELRSNATIDCPACKACVCLVALSLVLSPLFLNGRSANTLWQLLQDCYGGLVVLEDGAVSLEEAIIASSPFPTFSNAQAKERERQMQFIQVQSALLSHSSER
jgi:hypothetical protein